MIDQLQRSDQAQDALELTGVLRDSLLCGVLAVNADRRLCSVNPEASRLLGLSQESALGESMTRLPRRLRELIEQTFETHAGTADQIDLLREDGTEFVVRAATSAAFALEEGLKMVIVVLNDLTAAHKLASDMQRLDRLASIGTLSAGMAHEIKNALVAINTFFHDLTQRNRDSELVGLVGREFRRIDVIVSQMLKFAGPAKPTFGRLSLHRVLEESLRLIQPHMESKRIRLLRSFSARPDLVEGDDYQLEQAFLNLFLNALAAMNTDGQLTVSTELLGPAAPEVSGTAAVPSRHIRISVGDTGTGIPPEQLNRLFEPFFSTKPHGTGLGLAITRRIVVEHRGKLEVESEVGKGTTFHAVFPLLEEVPAEAAAQA